MQVSTRQSDQRDTGRANGPRRAFYVVWIIVGAIVIASAALNVLGILSPVLEFLAVGSLVAFIEAPIVNILERHHVPRGIGALIGLAVVIAAIVLTFTLILPMFVAQIVDVLDQVPHYFSELQHGVAVLSREFESLASTEAFSSLNQLLNSLQRTVTSELASIASDLGRGIMPFVGGFASTLFMVFLGLVLAYWLARDYPRIHTEVGTILGDDKDEDYRFMIAILSRSVGGYMRGTIITSLINSLLVFGGLLLVDHPYAGLMGVLTGILHLIPVIGPWFSAGIAVIIALFGGPVMAIWTLVVCVVAQNITDNVISPKVMQSTVSVHPAMSLAAIVIGSALMGPLGMIIAIPLCAALKGIFVFYFESKTGRQLVAYEGAIFKGTPYLDGEGHPVSVYDALGDDTFVADSEIVSQESVPDAQAMPKPDPDSTVVWSMLPGQPADAWRSLFIKDRIPEIMPERHNSSAPAPASDTLASKTSDTAPVPSEKRKLGTPAPAPGEVPVIPSGPGVADDSAPADDPDQR